MPKILYKILLPFLFLPLFNAVFAERFIFNVSDVLPGTTGSVRILDFSEEDKLPANYSRIINTGSDFRYQVYGENLGVDGYYKIVISIPDKVIAAYANNQKTFMSAVSVSITDLDEVTTLNFDASNTVTLSGQVVSRNSPSAGLTGIAVHLFEADSEHWVTKTYTDGSGNYKFAGVYKDVDYYVKAEDESAIYFPFYYTALNSAVTADMFGKTPITPGNSGRTDINISLYTQKSITGKVTDNNNAVIPGAEVAAFLAGSDYVYVNKTAASPNGEYALDVPAGFGYWIKAASANYFDTYYPAAYSDEEFVTVNAPSSNINIVLPLAVTISGRIDSEAMSDDTVTVAVFEPVGTVLKYITQITKNISASAPYAVPVPALGSARPFIVRASKAGHIDKYYANSYTPASANLLSISADASNIDIALPRSGALSGAISNGGSATINIFNNSDYSYFTDITASPNGTYSIALPAGVDFLVQAVSLNKMARYYNNKYDRAKAAAVSVNAGASKSGVNINLNDTVLVTGAVYVDGDTNAKLPGVTISAFVKNTDFEYVNEATTNAGGQYEIEIPQNSSVILRAETSGYDTQWYSSQEDSASASATELNSASGNVNFPLTAAGSITGNISNLSDAVTVTISAFVAGSAYELAGETVINGDGVYTLSVKPNKDIVLRAEALGRQTLWYDQKDTSANADILRLSPAGVTTNKDFDFSGRKDRLLTGNVLDRTGQPLAGVTVSAFIKDTDYATPTGTAITRTGDGGKFTLQFAPADVFLQAATDNEFIGFPTGTWYGSDSDEGKISSADVAAYLADAGNLTLVMDRHWIVRGSVSPDAAVELYSWPDTGKTWDYVAGIVTGGAYELRGTSDVKVFLRVSADGYVAYFYNDKHNVDALVTGNDRLSLVTMSIQTIPPVNLERGGVISGWVTANSGIVTISVQYAPNGEYFTSVTRDSSGEYVVDKIPSGSWLVYAEQSGCVSEYFGETNSTANARKIILASGASTQNIDIEIGPQWTISGNVKANGVDLAGAEIDVWRKLDGLWSPGDFIGKKLTDSDGNYLITGGYNAIDVYVRVSADGYELQYYDGQVSAASANPLHMTPGTNTTNINFSLQKVWKIAGAVKENAGGLSGVRVVLYQHPNTENIIAQTISGAGGYYEIVSINEQSIKDINLGLCYAKDGYVTQNTAAFFTVVFGSVEYRPDVLLALIAPPVEPLPPGKKIEDTIISGPNPANPDDGPIHIGFILDGHYRVRVKVYTIGGELVYQDDRRFPPGYGEFVWDGDNLYRQKLPNGVYLGYVEVDTGGKKLRKVLKIAILR
ncbi:MAG: hypothetical protein LBD99_02135 [Candidatus Margulisbacteria bacterium]|jgi:protocatechuate 3,4-dioxygenase beta subunit|nr:hypothetical protein [Candidatus Margulisiibacteriota bacterium]